MMRHVGVPAAADTDEESVHSRELLDGILHQFWPAVEMHLPSGHDATRKLSEKEGQVNHSV